MSRSRYCTVVCDECRDTSDGWGTLTLAVEHARKDGWKIGKRDYCPKCRGDEKGDVQ